MSFRGSSGIPSATLAIISGMSEGCAVELGGTSVVCGDCWSDLPVSLEIFFGESLELTDVVGFSSDALFCSLLDRDFTSVDCCFAVDFVVGLLLLVSAVVGSLVVGGVVVGGLVVGGNVGQDCVLQSLFSSFDPSSVQFLPSGSGTGLLHFRLRVLFPPPHVTEQSPNLLHSEYPPLTERIRHSLIRNEPRPRLILK